MGAMATPPPLSAPTHTLPQQESKIKHNKLIKYSILQDENIDSQGLQIKYMKKIGIFPPCHSGVGNFYVFEAGGGKYADMTITINWHVRHFLCDIYLPFFITCKHYYVIQVQILKILKYLFKLKAL